MGRRVVVRFASRATQLNVMGAFPGYKLLPKNPDWIDIRKRLVHESLDF